MRAAGWIAIGLGAYGGWRLLRRRDRPLAGEVALVTGGSRGLGLLLARLLVDEGCSVAICARDGRALEAARSELARRGADVLAVACDVADAGQVEHMVERVTSMFGRIDVVFNNAGIIQVGPFTSMTREDFEDAMDVNFWGTLNVILAVVPQMLARGRGRIVNVTSIGGKVAVPHLLPYDCSKFAAVALSEGLRSELAQHGIQVTTVVPGLMRTGSPVNACFKGQSAKEYTWFSLGDALPLISMDATRAARRILLAAKRGESEVTLSMPARVLRLVHDLFPGATADVLGMVNRWLPSADGPPQSGPGTRGMRLSTSLSPSPLTVLMNRAAVRNNQFGGRARPTPEHAAKLGLEI